MESKCPYRSSDACKKDKKTHSDPGENYVDYLKLKELLSLQCRLTDDDAGHDEHFFIIIHQNFELWFKQILYEIMSITVLLQRKTSTIGVDNTYKVCEREQLLVLQRLIRINCIFRIMVQQFEVMETMSCVGFASFRNVFKNGASGFQSTQFRLLEHTLGIKEQHRTCTFLDTYNSRLSDEQKEEIESEKLKTTDLFTLIDRWLARTPALKLFIISYRNAIENNVADLRRSAEQEEDEEMQEGLLREARDTEQKFDVIFDSEKYQQMQRDRKHGMKLSYDAFMGALMINCHANEPRFSVPYEIIKCLLDMDVFFIKWKFAHAMMVKRMLGCKPGTGGSGGYTYLRSTVSDRYMPFKDLFEVASYVIPPQSTPRLTPVMMKEISQVYISGEVAGTSSCDTADQASL